MLRTLAMLVGPLLVTVGGAIVMARLIYRSYMPGDDDQERKHCSEPVRSARSERDGRPDRSPNE